MPFGPCPHLFSLFVAFQMTSQVGRWKQSSASKKAKAFKPEEKRAKCNKQGQVCGRIELLCYSMRSGRDRQKKRAKVDNN